MFTYRFSALLVAVATFALLGFNSPSQVQGQAANARSTSENLSPVFHSKSRSRISVPIRSTAYQIRKQEVKADEDYTWEETAEGWQQVPQRDLTSIHTIEEPHNRPRVHPFSIASLVLLLAMAAMAWSSSEWDWNRLIGGNPKERS